MQHRTKPTTYLEVFWVEPVTITTFSILDNKLRKT